MIWNQFGCLVIGVLKAVGAQTGFVHNQICNVLRMLNSSARMINSLVGLIAFCLEAELDLVNPVTEAKNWEVSSFNCWDSLIVLTISASSLIVGGDWDEVSELLRSF